MAAKAQLHSVDATCDHRSSKQVDPRAIQLSRLQVHSDNSGQGIEWPVRGLWAKLRALAHLPSFELSQAALPSAAAACQQQGWCEHLARTSGARTQDPASEPSNCLRRSTVKVMRPHQIVTDLALVWSIYIELCGSGLGSSTVLGSLATALLTGSHLF